MTYEALDIETINIEGVERPFCIAITAGNTIKFKMVDPRANEWGKIVDFLLENCSYKKIYYVHNLTFEMMVFFKYLKEKNVKLDIISADKVFYSTNIIYNKKTIKLRCSYRLTMLSLDNLAKITESNEKGVFPYSILNKDIEEKMYLKNEMFKNNEDYEKFINENRDFILDNWMLTYKIIENYCKNDALITKKAINKFWEVLNCFGFKNNARILTAAKLSLLKFFSEKRIIKQKIPLKYDKMIRSGYYGGRTEVFGNPKEDEIVLHYDWSGMYAQCMCEKVLGGQVYSSNMITSTQKPGFYWIKFDQNLEYPILPTRINKKLIFANGVFEGWYWFEEIIMAEKYGVKIIDVKKIVSCQEYDFFIKDFVENNNKIREMGGVYKIIGKNNNNTFYGRIGMDPDRLEEKILLDLKNIDSYEKIIEKDGIYRVYSKKEKTISNVLISASITSKARIKLYEGMMSVTGEGGRVLYTDTDSIMAAFKKEKYNDFLDKKMGEVLFDSKKDDTIIEDAVFALPKTYAIKYKNGEEFVKIKGFNTKPDFNEFKEKFYKKSVIVTENLEWGKRNFEILKIKRKKETNLFNLDKRIWSECIKYTYPIKVSHSINKDDNKQK